MRVQPTRETRMTIDLDQARAARAEEKKIAPTMKFGGKDYVLPVELPVEVIREMGRLAEASKNKDGEAITTALLHAMEELLGPDYPEFMANRPSVNDLSAIVAAIPEEYAIESGESSGSDDA